ncbi:MAG: NnrU family protein [Hyphomicrobiales bacterium]|nr:NnrU family protein [Hyphomicrobiales bacterium]
MTVLVLGLIVFLGVHLVPTSAPGRAQLVAKLGAGGYKIGFSVASLIGFVLIVYGMGLARGSAADLQIWQPPVFMRHITFLLMWFSFVLLVAAYVPSHIRDKAKHPMLAAVKIWALAHLLANGDLAGLVLFGSFLAWAVYDRISVKKRGAPGPLGDRHGGFVNDLIVLVVGTALYLAMFMWGHAHLIGIPLTG